MIIVIISCVLLIIGVAGTVIYIKCNFPHNIREPIATCSLYMLMIGILAIVTCIGIIIVVHSTSDNKIYTAALERECIVKQMKYINGKYEDISKTEVIRSVYEWNKKVYDTKRYANSLWINWFYDKDYVDSLFYIEVDDL